jgi:hypothetical protein
MTKSGQKVHRQKSAGGRVFVAPYFDQWLATMGASLSVIGHYPVVQERHQNVTLLSVDKSLGSCDSLWGKG